MQTLIKNKFEFLFQKNQHPTSWDQIPYWEFEEYIKLLNERNKEEEEQRKKQESDQKAQMPSMPNMSDFKPSNFKIPSFGGFKI